MRYEFDDCALDSGTQQLWRDGELVHVEPQVLAVLEHLLRNHDRVVTKIELLDEVWGDRFVSESALTSRIKLARRACGDNGREQRILKTVHSRGYRFVADLVTTDGAPAPRPVLGHRSSGSVVGRDDELEQLDLALGEVAEGDRRTVFVCGGIGSGKSTLVAEFLERQDDLDDWLVARGRCMQTRGGIEPYFCLFDALSQLARSNPDAVRDTLDRVAPSWLAQLPSLIEADMVEPLERRLLGSHPNRMLREGADAFDSLSRVRPLVLVLEDLQWADDLTLDVVDLLVQRTDDAPMLLVGTARNDAAELRAMVAAAEATGRASNIDLGPLDEEALADLVRLRLDVADVPGELVRIVSTRCDGVPLFAEEIVSTWLREGLVVVDAGQVTVASSVGELEHTVPPTLPLLIERELAELEPDELPVLEACAVAGERFDAASVAAGVDLAVPDVELLLDALSRRRGLVGATGAGAWADGTVSASYAFTHRVYRQVVYDRIPASRRALLHGRVGRRLEAGHGARSPELAPDLAEHFHEAGDKLRSVEYLRQAGEQAAARSAHSHAAEFLTEALDRLDAASAGEEHNRAELEVRMTLGPTLVATRGWFHESVSANYERALELCGGDEACPEAAAARYGLAAVSELRGQFERTEALLSPLLEGERDGDLAMEAHELVACSTFHQGAFDRSLHNANMVLESWDEDAYSVTMARIAEHPASSCNSWSSLASWALGRSDESLRQAERAVLLGERNLYALSTAVQQRAMLHQIRNEPDLCIEWADRCREVGREQNFPMRMIQADIYKGWALGVSGTPAEGMELLGDGLARFRAEGATLNEAYYLGLDADTRLHAGEPHQALELLAEALERMRHSTRSYFFESELHRLRARGLLLMGAGGAVDDARSALDQSESTAERQGSPALALRTVTDRLELEVAHGDPQPWRERLMGLLAVYDDQAPTPDAARARELLTEF